MSPVMTTRYQLQGEWGVGPMSGIRGVGSISGILVGGWDTLVPMNHG